jgi:putative membrane protein
MSRSKIALSAVYFSVAILAGGVTVFAQTSPSTTPAASPSPSASPAASPSAGPSAAPGVTSALTTLTNTEVLNFLHHVNTSEILEANEALVRSTNPQVRTYAQTMITDHQQSEQQVVQLAAQKGISLYQFQPSTVDIAIDSQLSALSGSDFDRAYLQVQLAEHQKVLQELNMLQSRVNDPDLQNLITQTIPVIQRHVDLATTSLNSLSAGGTTPAT